MNNRPSEAGWSVKMPEYTNRDKHERKVEPNLGRLKVSIRELDVALESQDVSSVGAVKSARCTFLDGPSEVSYHTPDESPVLPEHYRRVSGSTISNDERAYLSHHHQRTFLYSPNTDSFCSIDAEPLASPVISSWASSGVNEWLNEALRYEIGTRCQPINSFGSTVPLIENRNTELPHIGENNFLFYPKPPPNQNQEADPQASHEIRRDPKGTNFKAWLRGGVLKRNHAHFGRKYLRNLVTFVRLKKKGLHCQ